ncbi:NADP-dependent isocitrate dehydrogenase [Candidatus Finniella inopinata]|uniref:Isocitrate dehydrogenase [NADP] n=1 Tax=Candidatus Finniella inopinata TaxID=1696036 RepID=A0A4Q7DJG6_9PROT|nr:NADP-dependent isocitrate dehydrogenase [Candidatus Finniella inopinata]RZI46389.1 NADP-dependent isocitrate dehydrogenase [Candidatus Finniella inopinata]
MGVSDKKTVTLIPGDGVGPEITKATCQILEASGAAIEWEVCEAGAAVFKKGLSTGVPKETIDSIQRNRVVLKGPLETPVGYGEKSANVTLRKLFETYGNIRPVKEMAGVMSPYHGRGIDLVIVRENIEDLYAGIEHAQTPNVAQCLKLISRQGCEKISRLAFEFAKAEGRRKIHCATKANIMKLTEGLLKRTFEEVSKDYPDIESQHIIVDNCAHQLVKKPEQFDVIVMTNMNGDILSDLSSALVGGLGFAASANIGDSCAIFEAVHGSAPKYAGQNLINPTAMILSAVMMLRHMGQFDVAEKVDSAVQKTLARGILTRDVAGDKPFVSTTDFTQAVIEALSDVASRTHRHNPLDLSKVYSTDISAQTRDVVGVDIFIETHHQPNNIAACLQSLVKDSPWQLQSLSCRGLTIYPDMDISHLHLIDHIRCCFTLKNACLEMVDDHIVSLLKTVGEKYRWMHVEKLQTFDGVEAFSKAHGG